MMRGNESFCMRIDGGFLTHSEVFHKSKEYLLKELDRLDMQKLKEKKLSLEQFDDVMTRKALLLEKIEQKPIAYHLDTIV
ncbi:hypothetical protein A616_07480 [Brevibacillus brevis X23]|nr:hypothetical protein A616_07480 [Brevibacillus brevis X23]